MLSRLLPIFLVLGLLVGGAGCGELENDRRPHTQRQAQAERQERKQGQTAKQDQRGADRQREQSEQTGQRGQQDQGNGWSRDKGSSDKPPAKQLRVPGLGPQPAYDADGCVLVKRVVIVSLDRSAYPRTVAHTKTAIRRGEPRLLHIDRAGADENREQSLAGIPTRDGYDRDEVPPAVSVEGGRGADVAYVPSSDNRGAGASMGAQLADFCSGQAFRFAFVP